MSKQPARDKDIQAQQKDACVRIVGDIKKLYSYMPEGEGFTKEMKSAVDYYERYGAGDDSKASSGIMPLAMGFDLNDLAGWQHFVTAQLEKVVQAVDEAWVAGDKKKLRKGLVDILKTSFPQMNKIVSEASGKLAGSQGREDKDKESQKKSVEQLAEKDKEIQILKDKDKESKSLLAEKEKDRQRQEEKAKELQQQLTEKLADKEKENQLRLAEKDKYLTERDESLRRLIEENRRLTEQLAAQQSGGVSKEAAQLLLQSLSRRGGGSVVSSVAPSVTSMMQRRSSAPNLGAGGPTPSVISAGPSVFGQQGPIQQRQRAASGGGQRNPVDDRKYMIDTIGWNPARVLFIDLFAIATQLSPSEQMIQKLPGALLSKSDLEAIKNSTPLSKVAAQIPGTVKLAGALVRLQTKLEEKPLVLPTGDDLATLRGKLMPVMRSLYSQDEKLPLSEVKSTLATLQSEIQAKDGNVASVKVLASLQTLVQHLTEEKVLDLKQPDRFTPKPKAQTATAEECKALGQLELQQHYDLFAKLSHVIRDQILIKADNYLEGHKILTQDAAAFRQRAKEMDPAKILAPQAVTLG